MKFIVDTEKKIITLEESVRLINFTQVIVKMLGDDWVNYTLEKTVVFNWSYPIVVTTPTIYPSIPYWEKDTLPTLICYNDNETESVVTSYNVK